MATPTAVTTPAIAKRFRALERLIGNTPLLAIDYEFQGRRRTIFAKCEHMNLTGSIKDRMALHILRRAHAEGQIIDPDAEAISEAIQARKGVIAGEGTKTKPKAVLGLFRGSSRPREKMFGLGRPRALDRNAPHGEVLLPIRQRILGDRERDMQRPRTIMTRDGAARHRHGFGCGPASEDQQHAPWRYTVSGEPAVAEDRLKAQHTFVERLGARHVVGVKSRFQNAVELRHGSSPSIFATRAASILACQ